MVRITVNRGFTLIELMVVVALVAVFALIGIPSYRSITTTNRMATEMNAFVGDLQFARSEAIKRGQFVTICASANGAACLGANTTNWTPGWIVFADANNNDAVNAGESIIRIQAAMQGGDRLASNVGGAFTFNRNGFTTSAQTLTLNGDANSTQRRRCVTISTVGRVSTNTGANCP
ncbi:MAG: GspH/FimT family pseudopilin [Acidihalobacter sp.]